MSKILEESIKKKWNNEYPLYKLHELSEREQHEKCVIIGTLFKDQKMKPSVLKELSEENQLLPQPVVSITDVADVQSDALYIEDESQRYKLIGELNNII